MAVRDEEIQGEKLADLFNVSLSDLVSSGSDEE